MPDDDGSLASGGVGMSCCGTVPPLADSAITSVTSSVSVIKTTASRRHFAGGHRSFAIRDLFSDFVERSAAICTEERFLTEKLSTQNEPPAEMVTTTQETNERHTKKHDQHTAQRYEIAPECNSSPNATAIVFPSDWHWPNAQMHQRDRSHKHTVAPVTLPSAHLLQHSTTLERRRACMGRNSNQYVQTLGSAVCVAFISDPPLLFARFTQCCQYTTFKFNYTRAC